MSVQLPDPPVPADADIVFRSGSRWKASELKSVTMDAYFAGYVSQAEAEDLIAFYGLRNA